MGGNRSQHFVYSEEIKQTAADVQMLENAMAAFGSDSTVI